MRLRFSGENASGPGGFQIAPAEADSRARLLGALPNNNAAKEEGFLLGVT